MTIVPIVWVKRLERSKVVHAAYTLSIFTLVMIADSYILDFCAWRRTNSAVTSIVQQGSTRENS
jgi:hypothetical protein